MRVEPGSEAGYEGSCLPKILTRLVLVQDLLSAGDMKVDVTTSTCSRGAYWSGKMHNQTF